MLYSVSCILSTGVNMQIGIIGLPNVGKSTLFNALTNANAVVADYPFTTIEPNIGIVSVPDTRLKKLGEIYKPEKLTPTTIRFVDIAGLVKGASINFFLIYAKWTLLSKW